MIAVPNNPNWELTSYGESDVVQFTSIGFEYAIATIYEEVEF
jgi:hypothetical protein